jgi:hypothetical protein
MNMKKSKLIKAMLGTAGIGGVGVTTLVSTSCFENDNSKYY